MRIALLPYQRDFLELLHDWREDPVVRRYNPVEKLSLESLHARCFASHSDFADFENAELFFWLLKADEKVIGNISVRNINRRMLTAWPVAGSMSTTAPPRRGSSVATSNAVGTNV